ncbi:MAG: TlpA family protein disulfide reductase [Acidimicrobiia bacterium]
MRRATEREPKRRSSVWALAGAVLAVALIALFAVGGLSGSNGSPTGAQENPAPDVPFQTFEGESVTLSEFRGTPVVLNFFASWCPVCVAEMPDFEEVHAKLGDSVTFIGVAQSDVPPLGSPEAAIELRSRTGITYETFADPDGSLYRAFQGISMPTTIFIDADGNVVGRQNGAIFASALEDKIGELLLEA